MKQMILPRGAIRKVNLKIPPRPRVPMEPVNKIPAPRPVVPTPPREKPNRTPAPKPMAPRLMLPRPVKSGLTELRAAADAVQQIRVSAQRELEMARQIRAEAQKYQQETATRARSQAQQLILHTRLETQKEIEELISQASAEIQRILASIRVIRITAQEELAAQRKFTDAAKILTLSLAAKEKTKKPEENAKKPELCI